MAFSERWWDLVNLEFMLLRQGWALGQYDLYFLLRRGLYAARWQGPYLVFQ